MKILIVLVITLILASCGGVNGNVIKEDTIKVGIVAPFTGDFSTWGDEVREGALLAAEDINANLLPGQKPVELIFEDACRPKEAIQSANKLVHTNNIDYIGANFCIIAHMPMATITDPAKVIVFGVSPLPDNVIEQTERTFSTHVASRDEATALANYAYNEVGARTASLLHYDTDLGYSYQAAFVKEFERLGGTIHSSEATPLSNTEFRTELTRVKAENPDVFVPIHIGNNMGMLVQQFGELEIDAQLMGHYHVENPVVVELGREHAEGWIFTTPVLPELTENQLKFIEKHNAMFGPKPTVVAANAYDGVVLGATAYFNCDGDRDCMLEEVKSTTDYDGASGIYSIAENGAAAKPFTFKEIRNGEFVVRE